MKYPAKLLKPIKKHLEKKEKKLLIRKKELEDSDPFNHEDRMRDNTATDAGAAKKFEHEKSVAVSAEVDKALEKIKEALSKIDDGKYGFCDDCGEMIDTDRLSVDPTALFCVKCAKKSGSK